MDVFSVLMYCLYVQVDRSPCGSGVTARVAVQFHKKQIQLGQVASIDLLACRYNLNTIIRKLIAVTFLTQNFCEWN